jgi:DNA-binding NtrC family response regulator
VSEDRSHIQHKFIGVIDDEQDLATLYTDALKALVGYSVLGFSDPQLAYRHISTNKANYALLLSDLRMPDMTGIELLGESKKVNPSIMCILMSAFDPNSDPAYVLSVKEKFIDGFIEKPVNINQLVADIRSKLPSQGDVK